ncbi:MAG TPA: glycosyltransferase [Gemmatimonadaceae bacterium]|nr:glycosyltransferase [Gemmatimonadaceae bacterium]
MPVISGSSSAYRDDVERPPGGERGDALPAANVSSLASGIPRVSSVSRLRLCLLSPSFYGWGRYSGHGRVTRLLGRELARRGARVTAVVARRHGQREVEEVDGVRVLGYPADAPWRALELSRDCDADIYHSQDPSLSTVLAAIARPRRRHVVTLRDVPPLRELGRALRVLLPGHPRALLPMLREGNPLRWLAALPADALYCSSESLLALARTRLRRRDAGLLPTVVVVPRRVQKSRVPTVCFVGPWERHRRPERALALAARFPRVRVIAIGRSPDREHDLELRREFERHPNLQMLGPVNQFRSDALSQALSESWVLVSTAAGRGLPDAFAEGAAHGCAILADADPDGFASCFGHHAVHGDLAGGLEALLAGDAWRECGERAHAHALATFDAEVAVRRHVEIYDGLMA